METIIIAKKQDYQEIENVLKILGQSPKNVFLDQEKLHKPEDIIKKIKKDSVLIFNFDEENLRDLARGLECQKMHYGFSDNADFFPSDEIFTEQGINFKINHNGSSVPIWLSQNKSKDQLKTVLAGICAGFAGGLNFVEISEKLKNYK